MVLLHTRPFLLLTWEWPGDEARVLLLQLSLLDINNNNNNNKILTPTQKGDSEHMAAFEG